MALGYYKHGGFTYINKLSQAENVGNIQSVFVMGVIKESMVGV